MEQRWGGDDITFMTPTPQILRSHFFLLLWADVPPPPRHCRHRRSGADVRGKRVSARGSL